MSTFRFVHAADLHLDSPLRGLGPGAGRIRSATREALRGLVTLTIEAGADFMVIAGDIYDRDWRDFGTGLFFAAEMGRLNAAGIEVYLLSGNHDAESRITRTLTLPENVRAFPTGAPGSFDWQGRAALHGQGFARPDVTENLAASYPEPVPGSFNIGVLHTGLGGLGGHANYAPAALPELVAKGYGYWALGHVHEPQVLHERPHVVFSGVLQGRHIRESGPKGAYLVTVEGGEVAEIAPLRPDVVRWALLEVDAAGMARPDEVHEAMRGAMAAAAGAAEGRLLACRIRLTGTTALHDALLAGGEGLLAEARAAAAGLGEGVAWVEKVVTATAPALGPEARRAREDALGELERMLAGAAEDPDLLAALAADPGEMARKLPHELRARAEDPALRAALDGDGAALAAAAGAYLMARLEREEG